MVFRTIVSQVGAKRIPLIKFRKGGYPGLTAAGSAGSSSNQASSNKKPPALDAENYSANAIEDWELPPRYWRKSISAEEMEYINRGGPA